MRRLLRRLRCDQRGGAAVEYALTLPIVCFAIMGGIWVGLLMFSKSSLDHAVQTAARCMSVDANTCGTPSATQSYALSRYVGPNLSPVFVAAATGCGHTVTGQANFNFNILPGVSSVPLSASACYP